jgi:hypothetical protein
MKTLWCQYCGKTLTEREEGEWQQAWETGSCPSCGRIYDPALETQVELLTQDPAVLQRARHQRAKAILTGILMIAAAFVLHRFGVPPIGVVPLIVTGVSILVYGTLHSARKQARTELTQHARD